LRLWSAKKRHQSGVHKINKHSSRTHPEYLVWEVSHLSPVENGRQRWTRLTLSDVGLATFGFLGRRGAVGLHDQVQVADTDRGAQQLRSVQVQLKTKHNFPP